MKKNISKVTIAFLILGMIFCNYDAHVFAIQTKQATNHTQAETSNKESSVVIGDVFTANIIHNGKQNLPCIFKVLTAPTAGNSGTVQVGDGISSAIDKETSGAIDYSIEIQDGKGNKFKVVSVGKNAFTGCDSLDNAKDKANATTSKKNESTIQEKKKVTSSNATVIGKAANDGLIKSKKATRKNLVKGDSFIANIVHNGKQDLPCNFLVNEPSSGVGIMGTVSIHERPHTSAIDVNTAGTIELPDVVTDSSGVKYSVARIDLRAFAYCKKLINTGLATNNSITSIGESAFSNCPALTTTGLEKNSKVEIIGSKAFYGCKSLTETGLSKNTGVTTIGGFAFMECSGLTTTGLGRNTTIKSVFNEAFANCIGLKDEIFIQINLPTLSPDVFIVRTPNVSTMDIYYVADMKNPEKFIGTGARPVQKLDVNSIKIKTAPKNVYKEGDSFDPTGLEIEVTYDKNITVVRKYDDTTKDNFSFDKTTLSSGVTEVVVTYLGKSTKQAVSVVESFLHASLLNDNDDSVIKEFYCKDFDELDKMMVNKGVYDIKISKDMVMDEASKNKLKDILDKKTTRYYLGGRDKFTPTLTFDSDWSLGGNNSTKGNVIRNIKIKASKDMTIFANSNHTIIGDKVAVEGNAAIYAGINSPTQEVISETSNLSVTSGKWSRIGGGGVNNTIKGDVHLSVGGDAIISNQVGMSKSKGGSSLGMAGANTLASEHVGEIKGKAYLDITGNATINGNVYAFSSIPPCGISSVYGANLNGLIVTIDGNAVVNPTAPGFPEFNIGAYSYYGDSAPKQVHVAHYNYGDTEVIVKGDADIQADILYNGRLKDTQFAANSNRNQGGNLTYNINKTGVKPITGIGNLQTGKEIQLGLADGKKVIVNIGANSVVSTIQNVDDIVVGKIGTSSVSIGSIEPNITNLHPNNTVNVPNLQFSNSSTLKLEKAATVNNMFIDGNNSNLILKKTTSVGTMTIDGAVSGNTLNLGVSGNGATDDFLLETGYGGSGSYFKSVDKNFCIGYNDGSNITKSDKIYLVEKKDSAFGIKEIMVGNKCIHHIDESNKADLIVLEFKYILMEGKYRGNVDSYLSDNKITDANWGLNGVIPAGAVPLSHSNAGYAYFRDFEVDEAKLYYVHTRNVDTGECKSTPVDVHGIHAKASVGFKPYNDGEGTIYSFELKDSTLTNVDPNYKASGVKTAAFSLDKDNMKAIQNHFFESGGFYSIHKYSERNETETYEMKIPNDVLKTLKATKQNEVYLYTKDWIGNTNVRTVYIGDDFVNVVTPTKASLVAVAGAGNKLVSPNLEITNQGLQNVNMQVGVNGYDENTSDIKLVNDKATYTNNEMALELIPNKTKRFTPVNVADILNNKFHSLGNVDNGNDKIKFKFKAAFSPTIDKMAKTTNFKLNYHITPETIKP